MSGPSPTASNQTNVFTNSGIQLVGGSLASQMIFSSPGALSATSLYNTNPAKSGVGSLNIQLPNGASIDMVANNVISSGQIAADLKLRDQTLVQAQTQVDQLAATLCELAVRQDHGGYRGHRTAVRLRRQPVERVAGQYDQPDLHRQLRPTPSTRSRSST